MCCERFKGFHLIRFAIIKYTTKSDKKIGVIDWLNEWMNDWMTDWQTFAFLELLSQLKTYFFTLFTFLTFSDIITVICTFDRPCSEWWGSGEPDTCGEWRYGACGHHNTSETISWGSVRDSCVDNIDDTLHLLVLWQKMGDNYASSVDITVYFKTRQQLIHIDK